MKSPHQARPTSTPKKVTCDRKSMCDPMTSSRITPTSKTQAKIYQGPYQARTR